MKTDLKSEIFLWLGGAALLVLMAFLSEGSHHPDEHFQILEFAWLKLGNRTADLMPWEYAEQMRPTIQVWPVIWFYKAGITNPFALATLLRLISACLALVTVSAYLRIAAEKYGLAHKWKDLIFLGLFSWFGLYIMVRYSSENWGGIFFSLGLALYLLKKGQSALRLIIIGFLLGLAFHIRFQIAIMVAGFGLWVLVYSRHRISEISLLLLGFVVAFFLGFFSDQAFYGEPVFPAYNYFVQNLLEDKVSSFGVHPFWWYIGDIFIRAIPPYSIFLILGVLLFLWKKPKSIITWSVVPFLLIHFVIGHKEERFLYPLLYLLPIMLLIAQQSIKAKLQSSFWKKIDKPLRQSFIVVNSVLIVFVLIKDANDSMNLYKSIYKDHSELTEIYYYEQNPYLMASIPIKFYKRDQVQLTNFEELIPENENEFYLFIKGNKEIPEFLNNYNSELIYSTYPEWLWNFNFNNWIERSKPNNLYKFYRD